MITIVQTAATGTAERKGAKMVDEHPSGNKPPVALPPSLDGLRILNARQSAELLGVSLATFRRMHWAGKLPASIRLSQRRIGWRIADLLAFVESRRAAA